MPRVDFLERTVCRFRKTGAQDFVALNEQIQAFFQCGYVELAPDIPRQRNVIIRCAGLILVKRPEPFLGKREGWSAVKISTPQSRTLVLQRQQRAGGAPKIRSRTVLSQCVHIGSRK